MKTTPKKLKTELNNDDMQEARIRLRGALNDSINMEEVCESNLPQRGRPSKKLFLAQQQYKEEPAQQKDEKPKTPTMQQKTTLPTNTAHIEFKKSKKYNTKKNVQTLMNKMQSESFVMKLFDRSLDLSKYNEKTPLYPICRAWTANQPRNPSISNYAKDLPTPVKREDNAEEILEKLRKREIREVTQLPLAKKVDISPIPQPLQTSEEELTAVRELEGANKETLLAANMIRWRRVKSNWQAHCKQYETQRYEVISKIMNTLYKG